jgi:predicted  nucleic acid-binding Zn-ribbon protein
MKLKFINIIGILLTILIVGGILYPWSKNNVERFEDPVSTSSGSSSVDNLTEIQSKIKTIYQNLVETKLNADDFESKINTLKDQIDKKVTVKGEDYIKLINDIQIELDQKMKNNEVLGYDINKELQNDKITELNNNITTLTDKIKGLGVNITDPTESPQNSNIASIKSVHNGINLNVKNLSLTNLDRTSYNSIENNLSRKNPTIMIFLNQGCLKYSDDTNKTPNCQLTNVDQYFVFKTILDGTELLNHLNGDYKLLQENINLTNVNDTSQYPFNIICPINNMKKCLKIDIDGISFEDCRPLSLNLDQRWVSSYTTKQICF